MKRKRNFLKRLAAITSVMAFALCGLLLGSTTAAKVYAEETDVKTDGDWGYRVLEDGTAEITGYDGDRDATKLKIPDSVGGVSVTRIGHRASGYGAFFGCDELTEISIPNGVTHIVRGAFRGCSSLTEISIPDSMISIGGGAFYNTPWLDREREKNPIVVVNGIVIDAQTASGKVTIPEGVTVIGDMAFTNCKDITEVIIPEGVTSIEIDAFSYSGLTEITIPESVTSIEALAFYYCNSLTKIKIPFGVKSIEPLTFFGCSNLTDVTIPESVTSIDDYAFAWCDAFTEITIPKSVTSIGDMAFGYKYSGENDSNGYAIYDKVPGFTISGYPNTAAETYAKENGFTFIELKDEPTDASVTVGASGEFSPKLEMTKDEALSAVAKTLSAEQLSAVKAGTVPLEIKLYVAKIEENKLQEADKELIAKAVKNLSDSSELDFNVMNYLDIRLGASLDGEELTVAETDGVVTVSLALDKPANGSYKVIRLHGGKAEAIDAQLSKDGTRLTFKTDKFSTYAIAYSDVASGDNTGASIVIIAICIAGLSGLAAGTATALKKRCAV